MGKRKNSLARWASVVQQGAYKAAHRIEESIFSVSLSHYEPFTAAGVTGYYRPYQGALNRDKPIGVLFYFDGDYTSLAFSQLASQAGLSMSKLTDVAARHNMIFVPVVAPFSLDSSYTTNWWTTPQINGEWFRALCDRILELAPVNPERIWFAGYSGGAEFITYELLGEKGITPAGATLIAGGGVDGVHPPDLARLDGLALTWHVGSKDRGFLGRFSWSALDAAHEGYRFFSWLGASCRLNILAGQHHTGYPIAELVHEDLERAVL